VTPTPSYWSHAGTAMRAVRTTLRTRPPQLPSVLFPPCKGWLWFQIMRHSDRRWCACLAVAGCLGIAASEPRHRI